VKKVFEDNASKDKSPRNFVF